MPKPHVEDVDTIVCADGQVRFGSRMGVKFERLVSPDAVAFMETLGGCTRRSREPNVAVASGSAARTSTQPEQYFSREPVARSESRPQRSQYLASNTSNGGLSGTTVGALCLALFLLFLCGLMRAC